MNNFELCVFTNDVEFDELDESLLEVFHQLLTEIYFKGYPEQLSRDNPDAYSREYFYFRMLYE